MPGDDLSSVPGLQEVHRRALADKLTITTLRALADADQRAVYAALGTIRPRPSLARIAAWQRDARGRLSDMAIDRSAWHTAASFAVIFALRQVNGVWERRLEAEQTEVEPAKEPRHWPDWDCGPLCDWMLGQLGLPEDQALPAASEPAARTGRVRLRIEHATITDAVREQDLISAGVVVAAPPDDLVLPARLRLTVAGGRPRQQLIAAVWFRRRTQPGWSPQEPVSVPGSGQAEFDLSPVPPGGHDVRLLAWSTDAGATLAAVPLPRLTFRQTAAQDEATPVAQGVPSTITA